MPNMSRSSRVLTALSAACLLACSSAVAATPAQRPTKRALSPGGTYFWNYDGANSGKPPRVQSRNQWDWPVTVVFYRDATVSQAKWIVDHWGGFVRSGSKMFLPYQLPGQQRPRFDSDGGKKNYCDQYRNNFHIRIYGAANSDLFYDRNYGNFVVATTHQDHGDGVGGFCGGYPPDRQYFGYSERIEERVADIARRAGCWVNEDRVRLGNFEQQRFDARDPGHVWNNDGRATLIRVVNRCQ